MSAHTTNGNGHSTTDFNLDSAQVSEATAVVRTRTYHRDSDISYLLGLLRIQGATGTLHVDLSQGAVGSIRFEERQKIDHSLK